ncbi:hypothetical protein [Thalassospira sp.]|uniref:hypothetical protein n=1 Tax=Thalassospira sp. TaxID=1912094 RepID=UPI003AA87996
MKKKDKRNRRDQGGDAIRDIWRQRIVISKQDQGPDKDQVDAQREQQRVLSVPVVLEISQGILPLNV